MREGRHEPRGHREHDHHGPWDRRGYGKEEKRNFKEGSEPRIQSAQTFRRGRALAFLERMKVKRTTLVKQLNQPEFEAIKPVISGELKAVDEIIQEFIHLFELREIREEESETDGNNA